MSRAPKKWTEERVWGELEKRLLRHIASEDRLLLKPALEELFDVTKNPNSDEATIEEVFGDTARDVMERCQQLAQRDAERDARLGIIHGRGSPPEARQRKTVASPVGLTGKVLSEILARMADAEPSVCGIRARYLDGQTLQPDQVADWIRARAEEQGDPYHWCTVAVPHEAIQAIPEEVVQGTVRSVRFNYHLSEGCSVSKYTPPDEGKQIIYCPPAGLQLSEDARLPPVQLEKFHAVPTVPGSMLDEMSDVVSDIASRYGWSPQETLLFVLCGPTIIPDLPDWRAEVSAWCGLPLPFGWISLRLRPGLTAREVKTAYQNARRLYEEMAHGMARHETPEKPPRALGKKHLELFRFAEPLRAQQVRWEEIRERWNQTHPEWAEENAANFRRSYTKTKGRLSKRIR